jgi:membrane protein implicated in regulation of membrane protease activity
LIRDESSIGCVGVLTVATRGKAGPGEVQIKIRGGTEAFRAWSDEPLPRGATVLVVESRGARAVDVIEWVDVLDERPGIPGLDPPEGTILPD